MRITELFDNGEFVVTAEVGPPKGFHLEHLVEEATEYLSGITAVNVTDNQSSVMRTSTRCSRWKPLGGPTSAVTTNSPLSNNSVILMINYSNQLDYLTRSSVA